MEADGAGSTALAGGEASAPDAQTLRRRGPAAGEAGAPTFDPKRWRRNYTDFRGDSLSSPFSAEGREMQSALFDSSRSLAESWTSSLSVCSGASCASHASAGEDASLDCTFRREWESDLRDAFYSLSSVRWYCGLMVVNVSTIVCLRLFTTPMIELLGARLTAVLISWEFVHIMLLVLAVAFSLWRVTQGAVQRNRDWAVACLLSLPPVSMTLENVAEEFMWAAPTFRNVTGHAVHVELDAAFGQARTCSDRSPLHTHLHWHLMGPGPGCETLLSRPLCIALCAALVLSSVGLSVTSTWALRLALINAGVLSLGALAVGAWGWWLASVVCFHAVVGWAASHICAAARECAEEQITISKTLQPIVRANVAVLHTLIPQDVAVAMSSSDSDDWWTADLDLRSNGRAEKALTAAPIGATCILFCRVHFEQPWRAPEHEFACLSQLFTLLDDAVKERGFFKYQHIGHEYIVTCPRAVSSFSTNTDCETYPKEFVIGIVALALDLWRITDAYFDGCDGYCDDVGTEPLGKPHLKMGIAHGPAAGSVIGLVRSFFCIYGDTMNTAARLCALATRNRIHCTAQFAHALDAAGITTSTSSTAESSAGEAAYPLAGEDALCCNCRVVMQPRGRLHVKGKGVLSTFDVLGWAGRCPPMYQSCEQVSSRNVLGLNEKAASKSAGASDLEQFQLLGGLIIKKNHLSAVGQKILSSVPCEIRDSKFADDGVEAKFLEAFAPRHLREYQVFFVLHAAMVSCKTFNIVFASFPDFAALGAPQLEDDRSRAFVLLWTHWGLVCFLLVLLSGWSAVVRPSVLELVKAMRCCSFGMSVGWVCVSSYASVFLWPKDGWLLSFCSVMVLGSTYTLPYNVTFVVAFDVVMMLSVLIQKTNYAEAERAKFTLCLLLSSAFVLQSSRTRQTCQRLNWLLIRVLATESRMMRKMVHNLLPKDLAAAMCQHILDPTAHEPSTSSCLNFCAKRRSVVLIVDICNWTELSSRMEPISLARLANALFCDFDRCLLQCKSLFKIDNMGDAYVCCGWLPDPDETAADAESAAELEEKEEKTIHTMLYMAGGILEAVKKHRRKHSIDLHVRIGIGTGTCVTGVMGQLQARFQMLGPAVLQAHRLEALAPPDHVHVAPLVMSKLRLLERQEFELQDEVGKHRQRYKGGDGMGNWELVSGDTGTLGSSAHERAQDAVVETDDTSGLRGKNGYVLAPA